MPDAPRFTVLQGEDERPAAAEIPDETRDFLCHTFGALFADIAHQVRRGETAAVLHRLNDCAEAYGHVPLPADADENGPTAVTSSALSSPRQEG